MKKILMLLLSCLLIVLLASCGSVKDIAYLQGDDLLKKTAMMDTVVLKIQKDDLLDINVSSPDQELLRPFLRYGSEYNSTGSIGGGSSSGYLVEIDGTINFPLLGKIKVAGLTRRQLIDLIQKRLENEGFIKNPVVTVRFLNFRISILGEVSRPGTYAISSERITLFEALSLAGDLTIHGRRNRVAVIREADGVRTILYHDLRSRDIFQSPDYYLKQNDMVYVEPNRVKAESSVQNQFTNVGTWISLVSFLASMSVLIFK
ncbi:polysaccharide biosynthesis/export family protein [uncultured Parabacteroides sp.]|jgi:polysaccharide export outer membrane protein|uniref:polysaccharide biosynthesis/export family protein n=1 Tax=uncultured Parabacteroides sp. TaxID=512312 RepID=UPI0025FF6D37|nr:polysaccharide biosynthesis/export family protein [uncultured Parabacteroides sp.]